MGWRRSVGRLGGYDGEYDGRVSNQHCISVHWIDSSLPS